MNSTQFLIAGVAVALLIGVAAVFLASPDPDGLESTALVVQGQKELTGASPGDADIGEDNPAGYSSPMPDYSLGEGPWGGILAIVAGTLLAFLAVLGATRAMKILSRRGEEIPPGQKP